MSKRKEYDEYNYKIGRIAEKRVDIFLKKHKYNYKWLNEVKDAGLSFDFVIYNKKNKIIAAIEVESKDVKNRKYFHSGVDYLASKVNTNYNKRVPVYYFLVMSDGSEIYKTRSDVLKERGYFFPKDTIYTKDEEFCRIQLEDVSIIKLKG